MYYVLNAGHIRSFEKMTNVTINLDKLLTRKTTIKRKEFSECILAFRASSTIDVYKYIIMKRGTWTNGE